MEQNKYLYIIIAVIIVIILIFIIYYFYIRNSNNKILLYNKSGLGNSNIITSNIFNLNEVDMKYYNKLMEIIKNNKNTTNTPINSILTKNINILKKTEKNLKKLSLINQKIQSPHLFSNIYKEKSIRPYPCGNIPENILYLDFSNVGYGSLNKSNEEICDLTTKFQLKNVDVFKHYNLTMIQQQSNIMYFTIKFGNNNILGTWVNTYYPFFYDSIIDLVFKNQDDNNIIQSDIDSIMLNLVLQFRHPFNTSLFVRDFIDFPDYNVEKNMSLLNNRFNNMNLEQYSDFTNSSIIGNNQFLISESCYYSNQDYNYDYYILSTNNSQNLIKSLCAITTYVDNDFDSFMELSNISNNYIILERNSFFKILLIKENIKSQSEVLTGSQDSNIEIGFTIKPIDAPQNEIYNIYYIYLKENKFFLNESMFDKDGDNYISKRSYVNNNFPFYYRIDETINEIAANETFFISFNWTSKDVNINTHLKNILIGDATDCI